MESDTIVRIFAVASGHVQGVGFRYFVQTNALKYSLAGWVKNMEDGTVTMEIQGPEVNVNQLLSMIKEGNMFCRVDHLEVRDIDIYEENDGFKIIR
ncbi:acylphosphatase [Anaerosinus massiliensis]|uniref:acylphosphatase n=1 Tax=Massilibacillus massiliensis TaxID=1806837 RepID=UPI000AEE1D7B|nr:acylphosphatase [Massilibacillus massiliensis]